MDTPNHLEHPKGYDLEASFVRVSLVLDHCIICCFDPRVLDRACSDHACSTGRGLSDCFEVAPQPIEAAPVLEEVTKGATE